jgi:hypothetical protein
MHKTIRLKEVAQLQWLQNPSQTNGDNLKNARCETSRTFRNKMREYLKEKVQGLETNSKRKRIRLYIYIYIERERERERHK